MKQFHLPIKPYSVVDAINRCAAATGSMRYAAMTASADYNGHALSLAWNNYRKYYVLEYHWAERVVLHRGADPVEAVRAAVEEYSRQGKGGSLHVTVLDEHADTVRALGSLVEGCETDPPVWFTWRHAEVATALNWERQLGLPASTALLCARDKGHYEFLRSHKGGEELSKLRPVLAR